MEWQMKMADMTDTHNRWQDEGWDMRGGEMNNGKRRHEIRHDIFPEDDIITISRYDYYM